jgi:mono/diheme cytochrome c family protein
MAHTWRAYAAGLPLVMALALGPCLVRTPRAQAAPQDAFDYRALATELAGAPVAAGQGCASCHVTAGDLRFAVADGAFRDTKLDAAMRTRFPDDAERRRHVRALMAHPKPDVFAAHAKQSCESCHATEDRRREEALTPDQRRKWGADHMMAHPGLPDVALIVPRKAQASCGRCHSVAATIPGADVFNRGLLHYERSGCYACHATPGMYVREADLPPGADRSQLIRRPAPPLTWAAAKLDPRWAFNWILHPPAFKPTSRMPPFFPRGPIGWPRALAEKHPTFHREIPKRPDDPAALLLALRVSDAFDAAPEWARWIAALREPESLGERVVAACLAEYVFSMSNAKDVPEPPAGLVPEDPEERVPRVARGRALVTAIGCLGCHMTDEGYGRNFHYGGYPFITEEFATNLVGTGDKFDTPVGRRWLFHWIRDPKKYFADTRMPDFGLTDEQVADVVAYLLSLKVDNAKRAANSLRRWNPVDPPLRIEGDGVKFEPEADRVLDALWEKFAPGEKLAPKAKVLAYGERLFEFFGCYGCHDASDARRGARDWPKIELPDKPVWELIPEKGVMQRMPVIESNQGEVLWATVFGRATYEAHRAKQSKAWDPRQEGEAFVRRQNCAGCHSMRESRLVVDGVACEGQVKLSEKDQHYVSWLVDPRTMELNATQKKYAVSVPAERVSRIDPPEGGTFGGRLLRLYRPPNDVKRDEVLARAPPSLRMPGRKFGREWLAEYLKAPSTLRPKLDRLAKMPDFGWTDRDLESVFAYFDVKPGGARPAVPANWRAADAIVRETCLQCHRLDGEGKPDAPDLGSLERLDRDWLKSFLREPSLFIPRTPMPAVREEVQKDAALFDGVVDLMLAYDDVRLRKIAEGDAAMRARAVRGLRKKEQILLAAEKVVNERDGALALLDAARDASVTAEVAPLLASDSGEVRRLTIEYWADRGTGAAEIAKALEDHDADVRLSAIRSLVKLGAREHAGAIAKLLGEPDATVRATVLEALRRLRARDQAGAVAKLLKDPSENLRKAALDALVGLGARDQGAAIAESLRDAEPAVRRLALESLAAIDARDQSKAIAALLGDESPILRAQAARVLGDLRASDQHEAVSRLLEDGEPAVRWAAAVFLARTGHASAKASFELVLQGPTPWLKPDVLRDGVNELNVLGAHDGYEKLRVLEVEAGDQAVEAWIRAVGAAAKMEVDIDASVEPLVTATLAVAGKSTALRVLNDITRRQRVAFVLKDGKLQALPLSRALSAWGR